MKAVSVAEITDGMILARDVLDSTGRILLGSGTRLTMQHKTILLRRDIGSIVVAEEGGETGALHAAEAAEAALGGIEDAQAQQRVARVEKLFADVAASPLMQELMRLAMAKARKGAVHG